MSICILSTDGDRKRTEMESKRPVTASAEAANTSTMKSIGPILVPKSNSALLIVGVSKGDIRWNPARSVDQAIGNEFVNLCLGSWMVVGWADFSFDTALPSDRSLHVVAVVEVRYHGSARLLFLLKVVIQMRGRGHCCHHNRGV